MAKKVFDDKLMFAARVRSIAYDMLNEGNSYDMNWHKPYINQLLSACDKIIRAK